MIKWSSKILHFFCVIIADEMDKIKTFNEKKEGYFLGKKSFVKKHVN